MATISYYPISGHLRESASHQVLILEAPAGPARAEWLCARLEECNDAGARTFKLPCDFARGGPWAGVADLFSELLTEIQRDRPDLIERHALELIYVLPLLRRSVTTHNPNLTDLSPTEERTRNYPADRAVRNVHGLIDLLDEWKMFACPATPWVIACDSYDDGSAMAAKFFCELMRRRSGRLNVQLIVSVSPGKGRSAQEQFDPSLRTELLALHFDSPTPIAMDGAQAAAAAAAIEERIGGNELELRANLPYLIYLWQCAERPAKVLQYRFQALEIYNTLGLYADALRYGDGLHILALQEAPTDYPLQWSIILKTLMCHLGLDDVDAALNLTEQVGLPVAERDAGWRYQVYYLLAMMHARFKKPRDYAKGEEYLERSLAAIPESDSPEGERHFRYVFNRNGLAMIRNFQRRPNDAIELCRSGFDHLNKHLAASEHRLHRSILLYNIAQVYAATGAYAEALEYFSATIEMDPNYSEYYNERANILLQIDRLEEAKADYLRAIELSPPYFEVFTNLGQCYRRMGAMRDAIEQYSRALDLEPKHLLARLGRAKAYEEAGEREAAIEDYSGALALDANLWEAVASRGVLHYEAGRLHESLADLDTAIALKPDVADLHENREIVLADLRKETAHQRVN